MVELSFFATLSKEAYDAYLIAEYMMSNPGMGVGRAAFNLGKGGSWDAARLANGLAKVKDAMTAVGSVGRDFAQIESVLAHGATVTEGAGAAAGGSVIGRTLTTAGRWIIRKIFGDAAVAVAGTAGAMAVGGLIVAAVAGGIVYVGSSVAGSYFGDNPILAGTRMNSPASTPVGVPDANSAGTFAVFTLPNSGGTIWIGDEEQLKTLRACDTPNGGLCDDPSVNYPPVSYVRQSPDFATYEEALASFCANVTQRPGYWGNKAIGYGGEYWSEYPCN